MTAELLLGIGCVGVLTVGAAVLGITHLVGGAVGTRISKTDDREIGIDDLTEPVAAYDTDGGVYLGPGHIGPTSQIDDRRPPGQPYPVQPLDEYPQWRRDLDRRWP